MIVTLVEIVVTYPSSSRFPTFLRIRMETYGFELLRCVYSHLSRVMCVLIPTPYGTYLSSTSFLDGIDFDICLGFRSDQDTAVCAGSMIGLGIGIGIEIVTDANVEAMTSPTAAEMVRSTTR